MLLVSLRSFKLELSQTVLYYAGIFLMYIELLSGSPSVSVTHRQMTQEGSSGGGGTHHMCPHTHHHETGHSSRNTAQGKRSVCLCMCTCVCMYACVCVGMYA